MSLCVECRGLWVEENLFCARRKRVVEGGRHERRLKKINVSFYDYIIDNVKKDYIKHKEKEELIKQEERIRKKNSKEYEENSKQKNNDMWKSKGFSIN